MVLQGSSVGKKGDAKTLEVQRKLGDWNLQRFVAGSTETW